jgi:hypothetical protein
MRPGSRDAVVSVHNGSKWQLALFDAVTRSTRTLDFGDGANRYDAAWISTTQIVAVAERGGVANLETFDVAELHARQLTSVTGAAVAPEPQPRTNSIWFLSLYSRGYDLRKIDAATSHIPAPVALSPSLAPSAPPAPTSVPVFATNAVSEPKAFGLEPRLFRWIPQPYVDADGASGGLTLSSLDVIGRSEITGTAMYGDAATWRGGNVAVMWHGFLPAIRVQGFAAGQRLSDSRSPISRSLPIPDSASRRLDTRLGGGIASVDGSFSFDAWSARYRLGGSAGQLRDAVADSARTGGRLLAFTDAAIAFVQRGDGASLSEAVGANVTAGRTFNSAFTRGSASASIALGGSRIPIPVSAAATYGRIGSDAPLFERFALGGGPPVVLDRLLLAQRWSMPVLPTESTVGTSAFVYRVNAFSAPLTLYWWAGSTTPAGEPFREWHRVVGVEWSASTPAIVPAGTPAARAQIGVGESLDQPFRRQFRAYLSLVINPQ